eukprot:TRINITY_DN7907_c0_g1_i2.p1 TRINITY_DN7907_c0_g1~~TRINITY_DN7907_c0_g1_i2.p1  ORF type:complete len:106 (-),score=20.40 TRINITY_DN7907_c0_g1_i2:142-459(-)
MLTLLTDAILHRKNSRKSSTGTLRTMSGKIRLRKGKHATAPAAPDSEKLSPEEVAAKKKREKKIKKVVAEVFEKCDLDKDGSLSFREFRRGFKVHPEVCSFFNQF